MKADLHMHSVHSDGTYEVKDLVLYAKEKGLDIIALTDHDSVEGVEEAIEVGNALGIKVIPAMELSTYSNGESVHVLAYFPNGVPDLIKEFSKEVFTKRRERAYKMCTTLRDTCGLKMDIDRIMSSKGMITRGHMVRELARCNPEYSTEYLFKNYLAEGTPAYLPSTKMSTADGIDLFKRAGAFIEIAHPVLLKKNDLEDLLKFGVDGIEAIYPKNKPEDEIKFREIAKKYNLVVSAGSDFHGIIDFSHEDLAYSVLEGKDLEIFLERIGLKL